MNKYLVEFIGYKKKEFPFKHRVMIVVDSENRNEILAKFHNWAKTQRWDETEILYVMLADNPLAEIE